MRFSYDILRSNSAISDNKINQMIISTPTNIDMADKEEEVEAYPSNQNKLQKQILSEELNSFDQFFPCSTATKENDNVLQVCIIS